MQGTWVSRFGVVGWGWSASLRAPATKLSHDPAMATCVTRGPPEPLADWTTQRLSSSMHTTIISNFFKMTRKHCNLICSLDSAPSRQAWVKGRTFGWWRGCTWQQLVGSVGPLNKIGIPKSTCKKTKILVRKLKFHRISQNNEIMVPKKSYAFLRVLTRIFGFLSHIFGFLTHSYAGLFWRKCPTWDFPVKHLTWVVDKKIILTDSFMHTMFFPEQGSRFIPLSNVNVQTNFLCSSMVFPHVPTSLNKGKRNHKACEIFFGHPQRSMEALRGNHLWPF